MRPTSAILPVVTMVLLSIGAKAESWPTKPVKVIVPAAAGSTVDIVPRIVFEQLAKQLGQSLIVENRPGAGTTIGAGSAAKAEPDGYTILVNSSAHTIAPSLYPNISYHPVRDFSAVIPLGISPSILVVAADKGFKTAAEFVSAAKAKPGGVTFSSVGYGTATHLSAERFRSSAGISALHVPFKGGGEAVTAVMGGHVDFFVGPVGLVLPLVKDGKLTALAANTSQRSSALPNVPTMSEAGLTEAEYPFWIGLFAPARTPGEIVRKLHDEMLKALQEPNVRDKLAAIGVDPMVMSLPEFETSVERAVVSDEALVKAVDLKAQ